MSDVQHEEFASQSASPPHEEPAAKSLLLQRHRSYLGRLDRITLVNRALCLAAGLTASFALGDSNPAVVTFCCLAAALLGLIWRIESSAASSRLQQLEEAMARAGGGEWEDHYIRARFQERGHAVERVLLWLEPLVWPALVVTMLIGKMAIAWWS